MLIRTQVKTVLSGVRLLKTFERPMEKNVLKISNILVHFVNHPIVTHPHTYNERLLIPALFLIATFGKWYLMSINKSLIKEIMIYSCTKYSEW